MLLGGRVEARLEIGHEAVIGLLVGMSLAGRRHHAAAQLTGDLFPDLGVRTDVLQVRVLEREPALLARGVVAVEAVVLDDR